MERHPLRAPRAPKVVADDASGNHGDALIAVGPEGDRTTASPVVEAGGLATLRWDSIPGADAYIVLRDDQLLTSPLRIEGSQKTWIDRNW